MSTETPQAVTFENTNLNKVDPNSSPALPDGDYTFQVVDASIKKYEKDGVAKERLAFQFAVQKATDSKLIGRRAFETLFPSEMTDKQLKILANAVGIQQDAMGTIYGWLDSLKSQRPSFDAPIVTKKRSDTGANESRVNFFRIVPASN